jgi:hypothetical protein
VLKKSEFGTGAPARSEFGTGALSWQYEENKKKYFGGFGGPLGQGQVVLFVSVVKTHARFIAQ